MSHLFFSIVMQILLFFYYFVSISCGDATSNQKIIKSFYINHKRNLDPCIPPGTPISLDIVWGYNDESTLEYKDYSETMRASSMVKLFSKIQTLYPGSRFGVYHFSAKDSREACYRLISPLDENLEKIQDRLNQESIKHGGDTPERPFSALWLATQDCEMLWNSSSTDRDVNTNVVRIILLSTDDRSVQPDSDDCNGHFEVGDRCQDNPHCPQQELCEPSYRVVAKALQKSDIRLIVLAVRDVLCYWTGVANLIKNIGPVASAIQLRLGNMDYVFESIIDQIQFTICPNEESNKDVNITFALDEIKPPLMENAEKEDQGSNQIVISLIVSSAGIILLLTGAIGMYTLFRPSESISDISLSFDEDNNDLTSEDHNREAVVEGSSFI